MSAFIVSDRHINYILSWVADHNGKYTNSKGRVLSLDEIGGILRKENYRSVNFRYDTNKRPGEPFVYAYVGPTDTMQAYANCHCLDYQSNEGPKWEKSTACKLLKQITLYIADSYMMELEGWRRATWGM